MKGTHFLWISTAHAVAFTILLGFLHVFKFIRWNPLNWTERLLFYPQAHNSLKWFFTFMMVFICVSIAIGLISFVKKMPAILTSIVIGLVCWLLLEWLIYKNFSHLGWHSIPILTVILLISRGLAETLTYYDRTIYDDKRK